jgi:hypothetical protein
MGNHRKAQLPGFTERLHRPLGDTQYFTNVLTVQPFFQFLAFTVLAQGGHLSDSCLKAFHHRHVCTGFYAYYFHLSFFSGLLSRENKDKPIIRAVYQNNDLWKHQAASGAGQSQISPTRGFLLYISTITFS